MLCRKRRRGVIWKLLGLSLVTAGGVVGYAWYDKEFKKTFEEKVPYSKEAFSYIFEYLPESLPYLPSRPTVIKEKPYAVFIILIMYFSHAFFLIMFQVIRAFNVFYR